MLRIIHQIISQYASPRHYNNNIIIIILTSKFLNPCSFYKASEKLNKQMVLTMMTKQVHNTFEWKPVKAISLTYSGEFLKLFLNISHHGHLNAPYCAKAQIGIQAYSSPVFAIIF